jgi:hypothetical protein
MNYVAWFLFAAYIICYFEWKTHAINAETQRRSLDLLEMYVMSIFYILCIMNEGKFNVILLVFMGIFYGIVLPYNGPEARYVSRFINTEVRGNYILIVGIFIGFYGIIPVIIYKMLN